jgi:hypothetical protein
LTPSHLRSACRWLGNWSRQYELVADPKSVSVAYYLGVYCLTVLAGTLAMCTGYIVWTFGAVRSGMIIHRKVRPPRLDSRHVPI